MSRFYLFKALATCVIALVIDLKGTKPSTHLYATASVFGALPFLHKIDHRLAALAKRSTSGSSSEAIHVDNSIGALTNLGNIYRRWHNKESNALEAYEDALDSLRYSTSAHGSTSDRQETLAAISPPKARCMLTNTNVKDAGQTSANAVLHKHSCRRRLPLIAPSTRRRMSLRSI